MNQKLKGQWFRSICSKTFAYSLMVALLFSTIAVKVDPVSAADGDDIVIDFEYFDAEPIHGQFGWEKVSGNPEVVEFSNAISGSQVFFLTAAPQQANYTLDKPLKKGYVEWYARADEYYGRTYFDLAYVTKENGKTVRKYIERAGFGYLGKLEYHNRAEDMDKQFVSDIWYRFVVEFDTDKHMKKTYIYQGDKLIFEKERSFIDSDIPELNTLHFMTTTGSTANYYVDDITISAGSYSPEKKEDKGDDKGNVATQPGEDTNVAFTDIGNHWAKTDIEQLAKKQIVSGTTSGTFAPDQAITRGDFTAYLVKGLGLEEDASANQFTDVPASSAHAGAIGSAVKNGLITGMSSTQFMPDANITREQMSAIFSRAMKLIDKLPAVDDAEYVSILQLLFKDHTDISDWAAKDVATTVEAKIIQGNTNNEFLPLNNATRAEGSVMIKRLLTHLGLL